MKQNEYETQYRHYTDLLQTELERCCADFFMTDSTVAQAARYSLMAGGKRVRGVLVLAVSELLGGGVSPALNFGAAIEMLHCYSLIHDDLPCMDNADTRRGQPSCHRQYDEATALLAGDALLTAAFDAIVCSAATDTAIAAATGCLARAAGPRGMVYGQELDLAYENRVPTEAQLLQIHRHKTGDLIDAAAHMGAIAGCASQQDRETIACYSSRLGLVFQIIDDILDVTASAQQLGKPVGSDEENGKVTFATLYGVPQALKRSEELTAQACAKLTETYGERADFLVQLAVNLVTRKN